MDPAKDEVFLYWIIDRVKALSQDPQWMKEYEEWKRERGTTPHPPLRGTFPSRGRL